MSREIKPFANGNEASQWHKHNCESCAKYEDKSNSAAEAKCEPAFWIDMGFINGSIPLKMAKRVGCKVNKFNPDIAYLNKVCKIKKSLS